MMLLENLHLGGYPIQDPVLKTLGESIVENLKEAVVIGRPDGTMLITYNRRTLEAHRNMERGYEEDGMVRVRSPITNETVYNGKDAYQALAAVISYFTAPRTARTKPSISPV